MVQLQTTRFSNPLIVEEVDRTSDGETIKLPVTALKWLGDCISPPIPNPKV